MQDIKKLKGGRFGDIKKFLKKIRESKKFLKKNSNFEQSHNAENSEKMDPLGFFNIRSLAKYQKIERRTLWGHLKKFEKKVS